MNNQKFKFIELPNEELSMTDSQKGLLLGGDNCTSHYSQCPDNPAYSFCKEHTNKPCDCGGTLYCKGYMTTNPT